ncbi:MAG: copper amine oxidase N-terminal domain-containing protein [Clostridia bacterium]|nr:copper amine oxidase N-terminal domain-containing protein [Clostridia bacterium]
MKKFIGIFFAALLLAALPFTANAACSISLDGSIITATDANGNVVEPFVENGTTYAPVRAIASAFDVEISWEQETLTLYLGEKGGEPELSENINIYYNGEEFIAKDSNGDRVYPILRDGTTYLPIRAVGELFGKTVVWDQITNTAILYSSCSDEALDYFKNAVSNTALAAPDVNVTFSGSLIMSDGSTLSEISESGIEVYSTDGFSLSSVLPYNYSSNIAYLGSGKYFLNVSSYSFKLLPYVQQTMTKRGFEGDFSSLSILVTTSGGYIKDISVSAAMNTTLEGMAFYVPFTIEAEVSYPEDFEFLLTPLPSGGSDLTDTSAEDATDSTAETTTSAVQNNASSDAADISAFIRKYMSAAYSADSTALAAMLYKDDYNSIFGSFSNAQTTLRLSEIKRSLEKFYANADGEYEVDSMEYLTTDSETIEKSVAVAISVTISDGDDSHVNEVTFTINKIDGTWYLDKASFTSLS